METSEFFNRTRGVVNRLTSLAGENHITCAMVVTAQADQNTKALISHCDAVIKMFSEFKDELIKIDAELSEESANSINIPSGQERKQFRNLKYSKE